MSPQNSPPYLKECSSKPYASDECESACVGISDGNDGGNATYGNGTYGNETYCDTSNDCQSLYFCDLYPVAPWCESCLG